MKIWHRGMLLATVGAMVAIPAAAAPRQAHGSLEQRVAALEQEVGRYHDRDAIEKLTRAYGYYSDKGLWDQVIPLFVDDARIEIAGRGAYSGKDAARRLFLGAVGQGKIGLKPGFLATHMILQGIVDVAPDGLNATGRWRELAMVGNLGGMSSFAEGVLQVAYAKDRGTWKFKDMQWFPTFYTPFDKGWNKQANPINKPSAISPPDAAPSTFDIFPGHYVVPFAYPNPVTGEKWTIEKTQRYSTHGYSPKDEPLTAMPAEAPKP